MRSKGYFKTRADAEKMKKYLESLEKKFRQWGYYNFWQYYSIYKLSDGRYSVQGRRYARPKEAKTKSHYPPRSLKVKKIPVPKFGYRTKRRKGRR